jgi:serine/threonine protein kinase/class 3 adenylate cyclase
MDYGHFRLLRQIGAGRDGSWYRAEDLRDGRPAEVRCLDGARADPARWHTLGRRLALARDLAHRAAVRLHVSDLEHEPPYVALEWAREPSLAAVVRDSGPLEPPAVVRLVQDLAAALAEAHKLGLAHGRLLPGALACTADRRVRLDFTGTAEAPGPFADLDARCRPPEAQDPDWPDPTGDLYSLGALFFWLLAGVPPPPGAAGRELQQRRLVIDSALARLVEELLAADPGERPPARQVAVQLNPHVSMGGRTALPAPAEPEGAQTVAAATAADAGANGDAGAPSAAPLPPQLGRFRLGEKLGEGGMGAVYRAEDVTDGRTVAIKVLRADMARSAQALRRFRKEALLLRKVNNAYVTNLLEVNEDAGVHYLALEFVAGPSLDQWIDDHGPLPEPAAVAVAADVARALADAHEREIIHRDVKPDNILLVETPPAGAQCFRVKLSDFGIARHIVERQSLQLTQSGSLLGTPLYMAPEQGMGNAVDPRTDVYALGATLFHLLTGRPPFQASTAMGLIAQHCSEPPPDLRQLRPKLSDGVCRVVNRCLAKSPAERYADAAALLDDLERLQRGEPSRIDVHPRLPAAGSGRVREYDYRYELEATPAQLWPYVSNTERLNRAAGLPPVEYTTQVTPDGGVRRFGKLRKAGLTVAWEEHPFEWVEGRRYGIFREFSRGPFQWFLAVIELAARANGGTLLTIRVRVATHGLIGWLAAAVELDINARRSQDRIYHRIDAAVTGKLGGLADAFEEPVALTGRQRRRLDGLLDRLRGLGVNPTVVERFGDFLGSAPPQEVARIRPLALAHRLGLDPVQLVEACLHGAREGLLVLLWDILCPVCRIPSEVKETLRLLREHGRCEACNLDFELDFANSVEMIFRAHPDVRTTELATYCVGGPAHSPHVVAQVRVAAGERLELDLTLPEGAYKLRGPQLPFALDLRVQPEAAARRCDVSLARPPGPDVPRVLRAGGQVFGLRNDHDRDLVVRLERTAPRADALTAARASALALFRELFPGETLSPGQLVSVARVALLVTALDGAGDLYEKLGDARAFGLLHEHFRLIERCVRREGGALVKTIGEGLVAAFNEPVAAVRAGLELQPLLVGNETTRSLRLRVGIHHGPALAATLNEHLDYFGTTVSQAARLPAFARGGEVVLTRAVAGDPDVAALLHGRGLESEILPEGLPGAGGLLHRLVVPD